MLDTGFIAFHLGVSTQTVRNHIQKLLQLNWIFPTKTDNLFFLRSQEKIAYKLGLFENKKTYCKFRIEEDILKDPKQFKAYLSFGYLCRGFRQQRYHERSRTTLKASDHKGTVHAPLKLSCASVSSMFGVSISVASLIRRLVADFSLWEMERHLTIYKFCPNLFKYLESIHAFPYRFGESIIVNECSTFYDIEFSQYKPTHRKTAYLSI